MCSWSPAVVCSDCLKGVTSSWLAAGGVLRHTCEEQAHHCSVDGPQRPLQMQEVRVRLCALPTPLLCSCVASRVPNSPGWALCRYELQESKMLSMSTRRHEFGRQTHDEAAEVSLRAQPPTLCPFCWPQALSSYRFLQHVDSWGPGHQAVRHLM